MLPLARDAASKALEAPAGIEDAKLATRPFQIAPQARDVILTFLEKRMGASTKRSANPVEPFQLQLICQHLEEIVQTLQRGTAEQAVTIGMPEIGGESRLRKILKDFYKRQVAAVPYFLQRKGVRRLCSEFLINPQGRRLRMEESEIQRLTGVKPQTLGTLVNRRLLRRDQSADGNYYELSHDSLVMPVMDSRRMWFWLRAALAGLLTLVGVILALFFAAGIWGILAELKPFDWSSGGELLLGVIVVALLAATLWLIVRWGVRNFREFREMVGRSRI